MFVKNSFEYDARVTKEARTLIENGHEVTVVAILVPRVTEEHETTADGIEVIRVSRAGMGLPTVARLAKQFAVFTESRRARLVGAPVDVDRTRELGQWTAPATATPGDTNRDREVPEVPVVKRSFVMKAWGRGTTILLRLIARAGKRSFLIAKRMLSGQGSRLKNRAIDRRMIRVGVASGADVFHSHDLNTLRVGVICKRRTGSRLVYDSHDLQTERSRMTPKQRAKAVRLEGRLMRSADVLIMASPPWIEWNRNLYGAVPEPAVAVLNTPDPTDVVPLSLHEALDLEPHNRLMVYQGSIQEYRGIEPAIDAVELLDDVILVVIGYGYHRPALEADVSRRGLNDKVRFFGPIPNDVLLRYTASADIGMCNIVGTSVSYDTSLPNKLFEYMMAGVPVIGSNSPEIGRVVAETGVGLTCDPEDPISIAAAVTEILSDPTPFLAAMESARRRYNWKVEEQTLLEVYGGL
jgi:glycosyltransferase involved in cell wall biosynthesis